MSTNTNESTPDEAALEITLQQINEVFKLGAHELSAFSARLFEAAQGHTFADAATAAREFARQGLSADETVKRTRGALKLMQEAGVDVDVAMHSLSSAIDHFKDKPVHVRIDSPEGRSNSSIVRLSDGTALGNVQAVTWHLDVGSRMATCTIRTLATPAELVALKENTTLKVELWDPEKDTAEAAKLAPIVESFELPPMPRSPMPEWTKTFNSIQETHP